MMRNFIGACKITWPAVALIASRRVAGWSMVIGGVLFAGQALNAVELCNDVTAPKLADYEDYNTVELPEPEMTYWARKGHCIGRYAPQPAVMDLALAAFNRMRTASGFDYRYDNPFYRSYDVQLGVFNNWVNKELAAERGISREEAERRANRYSSKPGESEHQLGITFDIFAPGLPPFNTENGSAFAKSCAGQWLREHAHEYGFTMSYPWGKEAITCYDAEPWHWRYVGVTLAKRLRSRGQAFDEYMREVTGIVPPPRECPPTRQNYRYDQKDWCAGTVVVDPIRPPAGPCKEIWKDWTTCISSTQACVSMQVIECPKGCAANPVTPSHDTCNN